MKGTALETLATTTVETSWGWAGLAATGQGLLACAWPYHESGQALQALHRQLASIERRAASCLQAGGGRTDYEQTYSGPDLAQRAATALLAYFRGFLREIENLPVDGRFFTDWERKVYQAVRAIEPGAARSYGEVAATCGNRAAARAVGQAMAGNPLPLFIPCHRVVRGDGPGNYGCGGTEMKVRLLAHESGRPEG
ncbi:MAG: MGMT family protein [Thermacetogeniaceae bacterium]